MNETFEAFIRATSTFAQGQWPQLPVTGPIIGAVAGLFLGLLAVGVLVVVARHEEEAPPATWWDRLSLAGTLAVVVALGAGIGSFFERAIHESGVTEHTVKAGAVAVADLKVTAVNDDVVIAEKDSVPVRAKSLEGLSVADTVYAITFSIPEINQVSGPFLVKDTGQGAKTAVAEAHEQYLDPGHPASEFAGHDGRTNWTPTTSEETAN